MVKIDVYKVLRSLEHNLDFKEKLRDVFQKISPEEKIGRDDAFSMLLDGLRTYRDRFIDVSDDSVKSEEK